MPDGLMAAAAVNSADHDGGCLSAGNVQCLPLFVLQ